MTDEELIKQYRDQQAALNGGCSDGYCVIKKTAGMHTNGGCSCLRDLDFLGMQRVGVMLKNAQAMADRIEELKEELHSQIKHTDDLIRSAESMMALALGAAENAAERAEAKLARIAKRVDQITLDDAGEYLPEHPLDVWVLALNTAHRIVMEELEKAE